MVGSALFLIVGFIAGAGGAVASAIYYLSSGVQLSAPENKFGDSLSQHMPDIIEIGLVFWLTLGLLAALTRGIPRRYLVFVLCSYGKLPWRLRAFLDWACTAGVLRLSGNAYQFRHREIQRWLVSHHSPTDDRA
ncbi:hypothetical protein NGF19_27850 [Streptomyces sp. RY43-2]|uniref:Uncharacterized protein n=1 Tax=Streptomyces macrolidinus TaxID=2952607 RepID=A0ABT0ZLS9_9ACTN|nr:hypothetical protein [Streptomyces macrolidinus]MCN9244549.1 hypothetical protein [Streptomyces macrolidinus]